MGYGERYCRILAWPIHIFHDFKSSGRFFFSLHSVAWPPVGVDIWIRKVKLLLLRTDAKDIEGIPWILELSLHDGIAGFPTEVADLGVIQGWILRIRRGIHQLQVAPPARAVDHQGQVHNASTGPEAADFFKHVRLRTSGTGDQFHLVELPSQLLTQPLLHVTDHGKLIHVVVESLSTDRSDPDFEVIRSMSQLFDICHRTEYV